MAYPVRKNTAVYVYYHRDGKNIPLPRTETKHLDHHSDEYIKAWIENWERANGYHSRLKDELTVDSVVQLVERYLDFLKENEAKAASTITWYRQMLVQYCLPFFVHRDPIVPDPNQWPAFAPKLLDHLKSQDASQDTIQKCNVAMRRFWKWLQEEQEVVTTSPLVLRGIKYIVNETPLKFTLTPNQVLRFLKTCPFPRVRIMANLGYFFSLRSQETLAAKRKWFTAGSKASVLECCKVMNGVKLPDLKVTEFRPYRPTKGFAALSEKAHYPIIKSHHMVQKHTAFMVDKQRNSKGKLVNPKTKISRALVSCINEHAARILIKDLQQFASDELIFGEHQNDYWYDEWSENGIPGITLKDLRRASLYWLGHYTDITVVGLKNHARHTKIETTMKYIRRPEQLIQEGDLTLDIDS